jgi:PhzF family phenazine biosynthesis protein
MQIRYFHIDAFTDQIFSGNPAGVCLLETWLPDETMQGVAAENGLPETAFLVAAGQGYELRWFTPKVEIDLCGHGTLASAHAVFHYVAPTAQRVDFQTKSGLLSVTRQGKLLELDFPARLATPCARPSGLDEMLGRVPAFTLRARDLLAVFETEEEILTLRVDFAGLATLDVFGVIVTAPGRSSDFVSRFFAPGAGIDEDPVTGSAHCTLIPYWAERLGKTKLHARQLSERGGELFCAMQGERVTMAGRAVTYLAGTITI